MSIGRKISTYPSTGRTFTDNTNDLTHISGVFLIDDDVIIPTDDVLSFDYWFETLFKDGSIIPIHGIKTFTINDEDILTNVSLLNKTYKLGTGKYRHQLSFLCSLEFHQVLEAISGTNKSIIYYDQNRNLILMQGYKGLPVSSFIVKKFEFPTVGKPAMSSILIELKNSDDLSVNGTIEKVDWNPALVDRVYVTINVLYIDTDTINFEILHNGVAVETIEAVDCTVTDDAGGDMTFITFNRTEGQYTLNNFSGDVTNGTLKILDSFYLGCTKYTYTATVAIENDFYLLDDDSFALLDDDNFILLEII